VLSDLIKTGDVVAYLDDFLVATQTLEHHMTVLKRIFKLLTENRLEIRSDKCKFLFTEIEYLGYLVTEKGISPTKNGIDAVINFPLPTNVYKLQSFLGLCSYFRKFIPNFAIISKPLYDLLKKNAIFSIKDVELKAFEQLKSMLVASPVLSIFNPHDETELHCDASTLGFGAVLMQKKNDLKFHPIFYL